MQHRRNAHGLADLGQAGPCIDFCTFRGKKPCLAAGNGRTTGGKNYDIMLYQFFADRDVPLIQRGSCIVSPNHAGNTTYPAIYDIIIKGII